MTSLWQGNWPRSHINWRKNAQPQPTIKSGFRKVNWFDEKISTTAQHCWKTENMVSPEKNSSNQFIVKLSLLFSETVDFTEFLLTISETKISLFSVHTVYCVHWFHSLHNYLVLASSTENSLIFSTLFHLQNR